MCAHAFVVGMGVFTFDSCASSLLQVSQGTRSAACGGDGGSTALMFNGAGTRQVTTPVLHMAGGGHVSFFHRLGSGGGGGCEQVDAGEGVVLEAQWSDVGGVVKVPWTTLFSSDSNMAHYSGSMRSVNVSIPSSSWPEVQLRWRQLSHSGSCCDHWMVDSLSIVGAGTCVCITV